jgi:hypothetical protein
LQPLGGKYAELCSKGAGDKNESVNERKRDIQDLRIICPEVWRTSLQAEVHCKKTGKEHNFATKPDNSADRCGVRPIDYRGGNSFGGGGHVSRIPEEAFLWPGNRKVPNIFEEFLHFGIVRLL